MNDEFDPDAQAAHLEQQQQKQEALDRQRKEDLIWIMTHPAGRRFLWELLDFSGVWRSSYTGGSREDTDFREGGRNIGLVILAKIRTYCPELEIKMLEENR